MVHRFKKKGNEYTLYQNIIDIKSKKAKTLYRQLKPEEYSEARIAAMKEIKEKEERRLK